MLKFTGDDGSVTRRVVGKAHVCASGTLERGLIGQADLHGIDGGSPCLFGQYGSERIVKVS